MDDVKLRKRQLLAASYIIVTLLLYRSVEPRSFQAEPEQLTVTVPQFAVAAVPIRQNNLLDPQVNATAAYVTDEGSGAVLFSKNANTLYAPASTTKLMTALVARKLYRPGAVVTVNLVTPVGGTVIGLKNGEQYTLDSLLEAALVQSANDAAQVIAEFHPEGVDGFVAEMNQTATELGMTSTNFSNPTGFDAKDHYSTARDLTILAREAVKDTQLRRIVSTKETAILDTTGKRRILLRNTNQLLGKDPRVIGVKTGTTEEAGEVLVTLTDDGLHRLLFVVLGSKSRYTDTQTLFDWVASSFTWFSPEEIIKQQYDRE